MKRTVVNCDYCYNKSIIYKLNEDTGNFDYEMGY